VSAIPRPFAHHGCEKMVYDVRMGPLAVRRGQSIFVTYPANPSGREAHPHVRTHDCAARAWSEPVQVGAVPHFDHHFNPVLWFDCDERIHVLFKCHGRDGGTHMVSERPADIGDWRVGPQISSSISYPRAFMRSDGSVVLYYRALGHMGYWVYQVARDGGHVWSAPTPTVDFDRDPVSIEDCWAGTYQTVLMDPDEDALHIGFVYWDERKAVNPLYGVRLSSINRYHLYYLKLHLSTGELRNAQGSAVSRPANRHQAERCKLLDTGHRLTNMPAMALDDTGQPCFLLPMSGDSPWQCTFHFIRCGKGGITDTPIIDTNHTWSGCDLRNLGGRKWLAYLIVGSVEGEMLSYGGGDLEEWRSDDDGATWRRVRQLVPEPGLLYNNPCPVVDVAGGTMADAVLFYGWEGPGSMQPVGAGGTTTTELRGKAFLWHDGKWL